MNNMRNLTTILKLVTMAAVLTTSIIYICDSEFLRTKIYEYKKSQIKQKYGILYQSYLNLGYSDDEVYLILKDKNQNPYPKYKDFDFSDNMNDTIVILPKNSW